MDANTLKALHGSVRKWIKIATWEGVDGGSKNCPLCKKFIQYFCTLCPVKLKTKESCCYKSPYVEWLNATNADDLYYSSNRVFDTASQKAAEQMALFLIDLLPENERARYYE